MKGSLRFLATVMACAGVSILTAQTVQGQDALGGGDGRVTAVARRHPRPARRGVVRLCGPGSRRVPEGFPKSRGS